MKLTQTPRELSSDCGIALLFALGDRETVEKLLADTGVEGRYSYYYGAITVRFISYNVLPNAYIDSDSYFLESTRERTAVEQRNSPGSTLTGDNTANRHI